MNPEQYMRTNLEDTVAFAEAAGISPEHAEAGEDVVDLTNNEGIFYRRVQDVATAFAEVGKE